MKLKREASDQWAYQFTAPTIMKFQPVEDYQDPTEQPKEGLMDRFTRILSPPSKPVRAKSPIKRMASLGLGSRLKKQLRKGGMKHVLRLTAEHVLVGNEDQLDAMCISRVVGDFVDTQFLWSINLGKGIGHVSVCHKRNLIVAVTADRVVVYTFDTRNIKNEPAFLNSTPITSPVRFIQVIREGSFVCVTDQEVQVFMVELDGRLRMTMKKKLQKPGSVREWKIIAAPPPIDNLLNLFFGEQIDEKVVIWVMEIVFDDSSVRLSKPLRIYELPIEKKNLVRLSNYSKQIVLINFDYEVLAVRSGYVFDRINVTRKGGQTHLKFVTQNTLIHITEDKVDVYAFKVDTAHNPPKILIKSEDSIAINNLDRSFEYLSAVGVMGNNLAIFYQARADECHFRGGEIRYAFILTQLVRREDKITHLLPQGVEQVDLEVIEERADMVGKMGMTRKEIYLRLWNNSAKTEIEDYKFLLDTHDYRTIKEEIERKLKKHSMSFREVLLLQQGCLGMLEKEVYAATTTLDHIKNYFLSHMFAQKLELYKAVRMHTHPHEKLSIDIQNYNYYKEVDVRSMLFELVLSHCFDDKDTAVQIRTLIQHFKFGLIMVYPKVLEDMIVQSKRKFIRILEAVPEILPYEPALEGMPVQERSLYQGIWGEISPEDWERQLYLDTVATIDNKEILKEVTVSVWFRRFWLTQHMFCNLTRAEIQAQHERLREDTIFYHVIGKVFQHIDSEEDVRRLIDHIQNSYEQLPGHIYGKIYLYHELFKHFKRYEKDGKVEPVCETFEQFLGLKDEEIFKAMFAFERIRKGFILKETMPLYSSLSTTDIFDQGLLNYFASSYSGVSEIKYLLNRINNEKKEFHEENGNLYGVLVRAMTLKLKIGGEEDIPIDEVLIYIQNIPLSEANPIMQDLYMMQLINTEYDRFKRIGLNMSIFEMSKNVDSVIAALIHHEVERRAVKKLANFHQIKALSLQIIEDVQTLKTKIFGEVYPDLSLFVYLTDLMECQRLISMVPLFLEDPWIVDNFSFDQVMVENLVFYMYKWRLVKTPSYTASEFYLRELVSILPGDNRARIYIESELELAVSLSTKQKPLTYPLSGEEVYLTSQYLETLVNTPPGSHLSKINIQKVCESAARIQEIGTDGAVREITLQGVYEIFLVRMANCGMLREVLSLCKRLIELQGQKPTNFVYPALVVARVAPEMIEENRQLLYKCCGRLFFEPERNMHLMEEILNLRGTSSEYRGIMLKHYAEVRDTHLSYSPDNPLLSPVYLQKIDSTEKKRNFMRILRYSLTYIQTFKEELSPPEFYIMFIILVNDPYVIGKFLYHNRFSINFKHFRCFLSYVLKEDFFEPQPVLELARRVFYALYQTHHEHTNLDDAIEKMRKVPLTQQENIPEIEETFDVFEEKLSKSIDRMKLKKRYRKAGRTEQEENQQKARRAEERLSNPRIKDELRYPFPDSDDDPRSREAVMVKAEKLETEPSRFDPIYERVALMGRESSKLGSYVSAEKQKHQRNLFYTQKFAKDNIHGDLGVDNEVDNLVGKLAKKISKQMSQASTRRVKIGRHESEYMDLNELNLLRNSSLKKRKSKPSIKEQPSIPENQTKEEQEEEDPLASNFGKIILAGQIVNADEPITPETKFNFEPLNEIKQGPRKTYIIREVMGLTFNNEKVSFKGALIFGKALQATHPEVGIKECWLEIYQRADGLQQKFSLNMNLKSLFTLEGLYLESQSRQSLFELLLPGVLAHLNDENLLMTCKVITLAFKKPDLEHEIMFNYLLVLSQEYDASLENGTAVKEVKMQEEKMLMLMSKIPFKLLVDRDEQLLGVWEGRPKTLKAVAELTVKSLKKRYEAVSAELIKNRWITGKTARSKK